MASERLIYKDEFGATHSTNKKINGKFVGDKDIRAKLYKYEQEESEGRLIHLPCKVGDKVYFIKHFFDYAKQPMCGTVCMIKTFTRNGSWTFGAIMDDSAIDRHFVTYDIGKTVFLTKSEAEQALKCSEKPNS